MRDDSVTIAKGIAIILMVMAHARCPLWGQQFINMFHMPLFFFFSGYCFKEKYLSDLKSFTLKRFTGVYLPFVKWSLIFLLLHNIFYQLNIYNDQYGFRGNVSHLYTLKEFGTHALHIITKLLGNEQLLGGYWFLHSLFFGAFLFYATLRLCKSPYLGGALLIVICLLSLYFGKSVPYFGIGAKEFLAAFFMMAGVYYKQKEWKWHDCMLLIPIVVVLLIFGTEFWQCGMLTLTWQKLLPYTITALAGTLMVFAISKIILRNDTILKGSMIYIGNHTLEILTWHFLSFKLVSLLIIGIYCLPVAQLAEFPVIESYAYQGWWIAYLWIGIIVPLLGLHFYNFVLTSNK